MEDRRIKLNESCQWGFLSVGRGIHHQAESVVLGGGFWVCCCKSLGVTTGGCQLTPWPTIAEGDPSRGCLRKLQRGRCIFHSVCLSVVSRFSEVNIYYLWFRKKTLKTTQLCFNNGLGATLFHSSILWARSELGAEPKTLNMVTKRSATELHLSPKCL